MPSSSEAACAADVAPAAGTAGAASIGASPFTVGQTHGILWRKENRIEQSSDGLGWTALYCSMQREQPYADRFDPIADHLIIVHRDGPVPVTRQMGGEVVKELIAPGGLFILPAGHGFAVELGASLATIHLYLRAQMVSDALRELGKAEEDGVDVVARLGIRDPLIENIAYAACQLMLDRIESDWAVQGIARTLALRLIDAHSTASHAADPASAGLSPDRLRRVKAFVSANLGSGISLSDMADEVALSPVHFSRQFKRSVGSSPHRYLVAERIAAARRLLHGDLPIAEIAYRCGFSHQEHLTRLFRRELGITPGAYRRAAGLGR